MASKKSRSVDIVEDVWKIIPDNVYDNPQLMNINKLADKLQIVIYDINQSHKKKILDLYKSIRSRLCKVLVKQGGLYNK